MERFLSAFRGVILQHGVRAGFATATSSSQAAATAPVRSAVSNVKPPSGQHFFDDILVQLLIVLQT